MNGQEFVPQLFGSFILVAVFLAIYFAPALLAGYRRHRNVPAIFALNLLLGWTMLGWVVAFVWACTNDLEGTR